MPRFVVFVRATSESETTTKPDPKMLSEMGAFNDSLRAAGILQAAEGFFPSSHDSRRITMDSSLKVTEGPFPANELVSGFWIWQTKDVEEAVEWAKKCPLHYGCEVLEIRKIWEGPDLDTSREKKSEDGAKGE
ncbi:hypothetical protein N431DRAFT_457501 [Stipitochalara longipes BDJ]|nr:hypothetical protein N431DRAFT_457501 [Stipitochalara longipes BDJ]